MFARVLNYETHREGFYETHDQYIDIQYMVEGEEIIGVADISEDKELTEAKEENDVWFYDCKTEPLTLSAGKYMVLYPNDLHCPGVATNGTALTCRKVVVKVKV